MFRKIYISNLWYYVSRMLLLSFKFLIINLCFYHFKLFSIFLLWIVNSLNMRLKFKNTITATWKKALKIYRNLIANLPLKMLSRVIQLEKKLPCVAVGQYSCPILMFFTTVHAWTASFLNTSAAMKNEAIWTMTAIHAVVILTVIHCSFASFGARRSAVFIHHILGTRQCCKENFSVNLLILVKITLFIQSFHTLYKIIIR